MPDIIWCYHTVTKRIFPMDTTEKNVAFFASGPHYLKNYIFFYASPIPQPAEQEH